MIVFTGQLADSVWVSAQSVERARKVLAEAGPVSQETFRNFTQEARRATRLIGESLKPLSADRG